MVTTCKGVECANVSADTPWGHINPVYSVSKHKIYINDDCARCNGVKDGQAWNQYVTCSFAYATGMDTLGALANSVTSQSWSPDCYVNFAPKENIYLVSKKVCYPNIIDECLTLNITESVSTFVNTSTIAAACEGNFYAPYIQRLGPSVKVYKNVFCCLCSNDCFYSAANCPILSGPINIVGKFSGQHSFSALMAPVGIDAREDSNWAVDPIACANLSYLTQPNQVRIDVLHFIAVDIKSYYTGHLNIAERIVCIKIIILRESRVNIFSSVC